jgi:hypothetical protein
MKDLNFCEDCGKELNWITRFTHKHGNQYYKKILARVSANCCGKEYFTDKLIKL